MPRLNTAPISGTLELLPWQTDAFNVMASQIFFVACRGRGLKEIETPALTRTELLLAKEQGETSKQIYNVLKTGELEAGETNATQALRFDNTVPLMRYALAHENDLQFPFKTLQVEKCFRGERAQRGRFREFWQADVDTLSRQALTPEDDAEVIIILNEMLEEIFAHPKLGGGEIGNFTFYLSNRKMHEGFFESIGLAEKTPEILRLIDKVDKMDRATFESELTTLVGEEHKDKTVLFLFAGGDALSHLTCDNPTFNEGKEELMRTLEIIREQGVNAEADLKIVRGLDYYTGTVFETKLDEHKDFGSICSGGRYDNLSQVFSNRVIHGTGGAIGMTRLFSLMLEFLNKDDWE